MDIEVIKAKITARQYLYSRHAERKRNVENLTFAQVKEALLSGQILEEYPDTGRGESCLIAGFSGQVPIHVVCGWLDDRVVLVTVYIPGAPKFTDPWTRGV